jgi:hypothetical protein
VNCAVELQEALARRGRSRRSCGFNWHSPGRCAAPGDDIVGDGVNIAAGRATGRSGGIAITRSVRQVYNKIPETFAHRGRG